MTPALEAMAAATCATLSARTPWCGATTVDDPTVRCHQATGHSGPHYGKAWTGGAYYGWARDSGTPAEQSIVLAALEAAYREGLLAAELELTRRLLEHSINSNDWNAGGYWAASVVRVMQRNHKP